jgi:hypothetical protein
VAAGGGGLVQTVIVAARSKLGFPRAAVVAWSSNGSSIYRSFGGGAVGDR